MRLIILSNPRRSNSKGYDIILDLGGDVGGGEVLGNRWSNCLVPRGPNSSAQVFIWKRLIVLPFS